MNFYPPGPSSIPLPLFLSTIPSPVNENAQQRNEETYSLDDTVFINEVEIVPKAGLPLQISKSQDTKNPKFQDISRTF
jgi:hypothetical protein